MQFMIVAYDGQDECALNRRLAARESHIGGALHYSGDMSIPLLNVTLNELPPNAIDISSDAVLIEAQFDAAKGVSSSSARWIIPVSMCVQ
jgi:hypothetical protein